MTRKDYKLLSQAIRNTRDVEIQMGAEGAKLQFVEVILSSVAQQLSVLLGEENPNFNPELFFEACGVKYQSKPPQGGQAGDSLPPLMRQATERQEKKK